MDEPEDRLGDLEDDKEGQDGREVREDEGIAGQHDVRNVDVGGQRAVREEEGRDAHL